MLSFKRALFSLAAVYSSLASAQITSFYDDQDLESYVSRPDIRAPKFNVDFRAPSGVSDGYWFVAPYADLSGSPQTRMHLTLQVGPHIYDNDGQLVWSGAGLFPGRSAFDFKVSDCSSGSCLSFLLLPNERSDDFIAGTGVVLDNTLEVQQHVEVNTGSHLFNMHEFVLAEGGRTALYITSQTRLYQSSEPEFKGWVVDLGFAEVDLATGKRLFEWWALDHVHPTESTTDRPRGGGGSGAAWDYFHLNSIEKDVNGDYLVSARHCNTIYKISHVDGSVIWRLGGRSSSFYLQDFTFSSQHDARVRHIDGATTVISFLNNGSDGKKNTTDVSKALFVALDTDEMKAKVVRSFRRPDDGQTQLRGNVQVLPNSNVFVGWSENSYMSEFTEDGVMLFSARFQSGRFATYRSYKFNFTTNPAQAPDMACTAYATSTSSAHTACHVSWNGATEVRSWNFYHVRKDGSKALIGQTPKTGFETLFVAEGCVGLVMAEAVDGSGRSLRRVVEPPIFPAGSACDASTRNTVSVPTLEAHGNLLAGHTGYIASLPSITFVTDRLRGESMHGWPTMIFCVLFGSIGTLLGLRLSRLPWLSRSRSWVEKDPIAI